MTFRGVYRDGVIVPGGEINLPEGTRVEILVARTKRSRKVVRKAKKKTKTKRMTAEQRVAAFMQGFGISRDRPDWKGKSTQEIARELRPSGGGKLGAAAEDLAWLT